MIFVDKVMSVFLLVNVFIAEILGVRMKIGEKMAVEWWFVDIG